MVIVPYNMTVLLDIIVSDNSSIRNILAVIGIVCVGGAAVQVIWAMYKGFLNYLWPRFSRPNIRKDFGHWALITESTDPVGRAFCIELAKLGCNVAMMSSDWKKLLELAKYIGSRYNVDVLHHSIHSSYNMEVDKYTSTFVDSVDVGILVNNVGLISPHPICVAERNVKEITEEIKVNVLTTSVTASLVLPQMLRKRKGAIINVASTAALSPVPLLAVYAATQSYIVSFSEALREEVKGRGITVQTLLPSLVNTRMVNYSDQLTSSFLSPSPETYVQNALCSLGRSNFTTGYWLHDLQAWIFSCFPMFLRVRVAHRFNLHCRRL